MIEVLACARNSWHIRTDCVHRPLGHCIGRAFSWVVIALGMRIIEHLQPAIPKAAPADDFQWNPMDEIDIGWMED